MFDWASLRLPAFRAAAIATILLCAALPALAQQVIVRGNANVDPEQVKTYVTRDGNLLDPAAAKAELDKVGFFPGSTVTRQGSNLVVTINAKSQISRVVFEGNNKLKTDTLELTVLSKSRGPFSQAVVDADVQRVKDLYASRAAVMPMCRCAWSICRTARSTSSSRSRRTRRRASRRSSSSATTSCRTGG